jgi:integrase
MAAIRFNTQKSGSEFMIQYIISHEGKERKKSMGINIQKLSQWDKLKQQVVKHPDAYWINGKISQFTGNFAIYKDKVRRGEFPFDFDDAISAIIGKSEKDRKSLVSVAEMFLEEYCSGVNIKTKGRYKVMLNDLIDYEQSKNKRVKLSDVSKDFYRDYGNFLLSRTRIVGRGFKAKGNSNNTINRKIGQLVTLMNWAFEKGLIDNQKFLARHTFKNSSSSRFPLTIDEVERLSKYEPKSPFEQVVLDAFLFACETGLRVSDIWQLRPEHIESLSDGTKFIDFTQVKGTKMNQIPLNSVALGILSRQSCKSGRYFEFKYSQSANRYLKKMAIQMGLNRPIEVVKTKGSETIRELVPIHDIISFHFARNTYITNLLRLGVNPVFVQANAGHSDIKTTMKYNKEFAAERMKETLRIWDKK